MIHSELVGPVGAVPPTTDHRASRGGRSRIITDAHAGTETLHDPADRDDDGPELDRQPLSALDRAEVEALRLAHDALFEP